VESIVRLHDAALCVHAATRVPLCPDDHQRRLVAEPLDREPLRLQLPDGDQVRVAAADPDVVERGEHLPYRPFDTPVRAALLRGELRVDDGVGSGALVRREQPPLGVCEDVRFGEVGCRARHGPA
jgi:hypothetical protein